MPQKYTQKSPTQEFQGSATMPQLVHTEIQDSGILDDEITSLDLQIEKRLNNSLAIDPLTLIFPTV